MANNLYTLTAIGATILSQKSLVALFNGVGSGKVLRVYKVQLQNNQSVAITGVQILLELRRITAISGGGALTPLKHNSSIPALPSNIVAAEGATTTQSSLFRRHIWSTDEPLASSSVIDEFELIPYFNRIFYLPITNAQGIEPLVLQEGEGIALINTTVSNVGQVDIFVDFTSDNT